MLRKYRFARDGITPELVLACFADDDLYLSRREIAGRLGVSRSNSLINVIERMVTDGLLRKHVDVLVNGAQVFLYERV